MTHSDRSEIAFETDVLPRLRSVLSRHPVSFAMIFGSAARDTMDEGSDIDLAVEFEKVSSVDEDYNDAYFSLLSDLDGVLAFPVDVVDVHSMSPRFARAVFETGTVIIGSETKRDELVNDLTDDEISVANARERVAAAAERLKES